MPILPLPQFEADLEADRKVYEALKPPKSIVVRFGAMKLVGEFPYDGDAKPGCGSKLVIRTHRGTEIGEMLTSTCPNSGCSKSVSRQEMLQYIDNSGGKDYPFHTDGRVLRVATLDDLDKQSKLEQSRHGIRLEARRITSEVGVPVKIVDVEPLLGNERIIIFYASEDRLDLGTLARRLSEQLRNRVDLKHVGARDEARITADYEKCGQYCCCKNFLKVLKPVSMKSAKTQKATLDPLKISGRCGRLMCCLRYEDQTYDELKKKLPHKKTRVGTPHGDGYVVDSQILTQLVLIHLDVPIEDGKTMQVAVPVEDLTPPISKTPPPPPVVADPATRSGPAGRPPRPENRPTRRTSSFPAGTGFISPPATSATDADASSPSDAVDSAPSPSSGQTSRPGPESRAPRSTDRGDRGGGDRTSSPNPGPRRERPSQPQQPPAPRGQRGPTGPGTKGAPSGGSSQGGPGGQGSQASQGVQGGQGGQGSPGGRPPQGGRNRGPGGGPSNQPNQRPRPAPRSGNDDIEDIMGALDRGELDRPRKPGRSGGPPGGSSSGSQGGPQGGPPARPPARGPKPPGVNPAEGGDRPPRDGSGADPKRG